MCLFCCNCGSCGKPLPAELKAFYDAPLNCIECGTQLERGVEACPQCGHAAPLPPGAGSSTAAVVSLKAS